MNAFSVQRPLSRISDFLHGENLNILIGAMEYPNLRNISFVFINVILPLLQAEILVDLLNVLRAAVSHFRLSVTSDGVSDGTIDKFNLQKHGVVAGFLFAASLEGKILLGQF